MRKNVLLLFLTLLNIVFAGTVRGAATDAKDLMEQADKLNDNHFYYQAEQLYRTIVENHTNTDYALPAQRKLVCVLLGAEKSQEQVDAEFNKLVTDFAGNENLSKQIHEIGLGCRFRGQPEKVKYYYNYVVENFADNPQAIFSQKDLVKAAIEAEDYTAEQQELDKLKAQYANNPELAKALCSVVDGYMEEDKYDKANDLNEYIVSSFPGTSYALKAQKSLVKTYIANNDDPNAQAAIDKLTTDFANQPSLLDAVRSIADGYRGEGKYDKAIELYQSLLENHPNDPGRIHCQKGLAISKIWSTEDVNDTGTTAAVNALSTNFNSHPDSVYSVFRIGEEYCKKGQKLLDNGNTGSAEGYFAKAIGQWQMITELAPITGLTDKVYYRMAECYMQIGDYDNAMASYRKVVEDWPNSKYKMLAQKYLAIANINIADDPNVMAQVDRLIVDFKNSPFLPRILYHIGEEYTKKAFRHEFLGQREQAQKIYRSIVAIWQKLIQELPESGYSKKYYLRLIVCYRWLGEDEKMIECCETMTGIYPDSEWSALAFMELGWSNFKKGRWSEAIRCFESGLENYSMEERLLHIHALYPLGRAYEETGQSIKAIEVYSEFISTVHPDDPRIDIVRTKLDKLMN